MAADVKVAILGAGFAGLCMGLQLKAQGESSFVILEKANRVGGTWRENVYPGAGCDIPSHLYSYSFAPNPDWPEVYSAQPDILAYIEGVVDRHELAGHIRLGAEVIGAAWDEATGLWSISLADGSRLTAEAFVTAWGQLNRPKLPEIEGRDSFAGPAFHSAHWDVSVDLAGKRVAVIGNGASAIQFVPEIAKVAGQLTLFQRSPNWIVPRMNRPYTDAEKAQFRAQPELMEKVRSEIFHMAEERLIAKRNGTAPVEEVPIPLAHLHAQVADPELRAALTPDFTLGCKRLLLSNDFYPALTRDDVEVVPHALAAVEGSTVVGADGSRREVDVIIFGTGFDVSHPPIAQRVRGADGAPLSEAWTDSPEAYLGTTLAGAPNAF
ncbi:MAG: flavin-containing monooxygenase, partial [Phenylobacterium sp.]